MHVASDLTPQQVKAYRLADNRTAEETSWDLELLPLEISELADLGYDLELLGFDADELANSPSRRPRVSPIPTRCPRSPRSPSPSRATSGILGHHRLLCGDATDADQVRRLMAGERAALMATDPPYLVDYDGGNHPRPGQRRQEAGRGVRRSTGTPTSITRPRSSFYAGFLAAALAEALGEAPAIYQWFGMTRIECVLAAWRAGGLLPHQVLIWKKSRAVLTTATTSGTTSHALRLDRGQAARRCGRRRTPARVGDDSRIDDGAAGVHPTQKPVETVRRPIAYHTTPGELDLRALRRLGHGAHRRRGDSGGAAMRSSSRPPSATWSSPAGSASPGKAVRHG